MENQICYPIEPDESDHLELKLARILEPLKSSNMQPCDQALMAFSKFLVSQLK